MNKVFSTAEISNEHTERKKDEMRAIKPFECPSCGMLYDAASWKIAKKEKCHYCKQEVENGK